MSGRSHHSALDSRAFKTRTEERTHHHHEPVIFGTVFPPATWNKRRLRLSSALHYPAQHYSTQNAARKKETLLPACCCWKLPRGWRRALWVEDAKVCLSAILWCLRKAAAVVVVAAAVARLVLSRFPPPGKFGFLGIWRRRYLFYSEEVKEPRR